MRIRLLFSDSILSAYVCVLWGVCSSVPNISEYFPMKESGQERKSTRSKGKHFFSHWPQPSNSILFHINRSPPSFNIYSLLNYIFWSGKFIFLSFFTFFVLLWRIPYTFNHLLTCVVFSWCVTILFHKCCCSSPVCSIFWCLWYKLNQPASFSVVLVYSAYLISVIWLLFDCFFICFFWILLLVCHRSFFPWSVKLLIIFFFLWFDFSRTQFHYPNYWRRG